MEPFKSPIINTLEIASGSELHVQTGWSSMIRLIEKKYRELNSQKKVFKISIDGYLNVEWDRVVQELRTLSLPESIELKLIDMHTFLKSQSERKKIISPSLPAGEPVFGRKFTGRLSSFFHPDRLMKAADEMRGSAENMLCIYYGCGALLEPLKGLYDLTFYLDITREEVLKRNKAWVDRKSKTQSVSPRQIYYVDFPIYDRHRKKSYPAVDFYIDANDTNKPRILPAEAVKKIIQQLMKMPLRIKPLYEPGVWGGQWLKQNRKLPKDMINCAYGFEIIAPEQSVITKIGNQTIEFPFNLLMEMSGGSLMGEKAYKRFGDEFPVRIAYDDTWKGGNLSIQAHPTTKYMKQTFGEKIHQAEMYYIFDAKSKSIVHLGLQEGAKKEDFYKAARKSEKSRKSFDHTKYVNVIPAEKGKIYLIPPGTVHGAGANELVLEISSTPYRYTFKIYDYIRPDLDGNFRPIHIEHAFKNIKFFRKTKWVAENLVPKPKLLHHITKGKQEWKEYIIADRREFYHKVHRFEFKNSYEDNTMNKFHLLNLVEGDIVLINAKSGKHRIHEMALSETILLPAAVGPYEVVNKGKTPCKVLKTLLRA